MSASASDNRLPSFPRKPESAPAQPRKSCLELIIANSRLIIVFAALLAVACGSSEPEPPPAPAPSDTDEVVRIGNEVGNRLPNFELTLTSNGEKLTSAALVESGRPAFLFFFATT